MKRYFLILFFAIALGVSSAWAAEKSPFHLPQTSSAAFRHAYMEQITAVLARVYKGDSGDGVPWVHFSNGGSVGVRCDFSDDNKSVQCSADKVPSNSQGIFEQQRFKRIGKTDSFAFNTEVNDKTDFGDIASRVLTVLHDGLGLEQGHIVIMSLRAKKEASYRIFPKDSPFHLPQTDAEKALDKIFQTENTDRNLQPFALGEPWYEPSKDTGYAGLFTEGVLKAWRETEKKLAQADCGGKYEAGEECGFDFDPIVCGQDHPDTFIYRTLHSNANEAIITYTYPDFIARSDAFAGSGPTYRMVKERGDWKMDGAYCSKDENSHFNMAQDGHLPDAR